MLNLLQSGPDILRVITSAAALVDVLSAFADTDSTMTPTSNVLSGVTPTAISTATTTTVVATPSSSLVRNVKYVNIRNRDTALSCDVTITYDRNTGATVSQLFKCTLLVGEHLIFNEGTWFHYDANGGVYGAITSSHELNNFSTGAQTPAAATLTQLAGSSVSMPTSKMRIGTMIRWRFDITKTGAGTATSAYHVRIGTANSTGDAAVFTFTKPLGTAVIDVGIIEITMIIRGPLTASCIAVAFFELRHNLPTTGHAVAYTTAAPGQITTVSGTFDATVSGLFASLSCTTGAADAITTQLLTAETWNLQP